MTTSASAAIDAPMTDPTSFVFGGIAFDVCLDRGLRWELSDEHRGFVSPYRAVGARLSISVSASPELNEELGREIEVQWDAETAHARTARVRAEVRCLSPGRYVAAARVAPNTNGFTSLLTLVASAVDVHRGGLLLHATGVDLDGRAILFVGPSGAGKTTSANHCRGLSWFARDRAAVYPWRGELLVTGMPGGDPIDGPRATETPRPLGAILRVHKRRGGEPRVTWAEREIERLRILRESAQMPAGTPEPELLARLSNLGARAHVGSLDMVLGADPIPALREALRGGEG